MKRLIFFAIFCLCSQTSLALGDTLTTGSVNHRSASNANSSLTLEDTRHLLSRTGFGASPKEINQLFGLSRAEAIQTIISGLRPTPQTSPPSWTENAAPYHWARQELSKDNRRKFTEARDNEIRSLRQWWVQEMISTDSPQTERLLLFWQNHFATGYSAINDQALAIARQHFMLREYGSGNFRTLLKQIIRDPAMLNYLDNNGSRKAKPNENFARELMELFTLGEGNYSEQDIKNAARALTGYGYSEIYDQKFVYKYWDHDKSNKTIFDQTGNFDGDDLIDLILAKPAAARFITAKLWRTLVGDVHTDSELLSPHATAFRQSDYDIKTLYKSILLSDEFWRGANRAGIVHSPVSLTIGTVRSTGVLPADWQTLPAKLSQMGQRLFDPPNVAGWPGGEAWITPGRLLSRLEWLEQLAQADNTQLRTNATMSMNPMASKNPMASNEPAMQSQNSMQSMNKMNSTDSNQLVVRMASEEFDQPAKYLVEVHGKDNLLWSSGEMSLAGGHDTKRMGRINRKNMPWQLISFPVDIDHNNITAIEISFLNDGTTPQGADRNLFVSRVLFGNKTWSPINGKQTGKCARKKPQQQGSLYCNGTVRMEKYTTSSPAHTVKPANNTLRVSGAYVNFVRPPKRKPHAEIVFSLSDVEFNDRYWNTMSVKYVKNKDGYAVWMNNHDCWPDCFEKWPECAWLNEHAPTHKTVSLSLSSKKKNLRCMYDGLSRADQELAQALWMLVDDLYAVGANSYKMRRNKLAINYENWKPQIELMQRQVENSRYYNSAIAFEVSPRPIIDATLSESAASPLPGGLDSIEWLSELEQLQQRMPKIDLALLLLPSEPAMPLTTNNLADVITDLNYQLK